MVYFKNLIAEKVVTAADSEHVIVLSEQHTSTGSYDETDFVKQNYFGKSQLGKSEEEVTLTRTICSSAYSPVVLHRCEKYSSNSI